MLAHQTPCANNDSTSSIPFLRRYVTVPIKLKLNICSVPLSKLIYRIYLVLYIITAFQNGSAYTEVCRNMQKLPPADITCTLSMYSYTELIGLYTRVQCYYIIFFFLKLCSLDTMQTTQCKLHNACLCFCCIMIIYPVPSLCCCSASSHQDGYQCKSNMPPQGPNC